MYYLLLTTYCLLPTSYLLLITYYLQFHYLLRTTYYVVLNIYHSPPTTYYLFFTAYYLLLTTYYSLLPTYYLLLTAYYLLLTTYSPHHFVGFLFLGCTPAAAAVRPPSDRRPPSAVLRGRHFSPPGPRNRGGGVLYRALAEATRAFGPMDFATFGLEGRETVAGACSTGLWQ